MNIPYPKIRVKNCSQLNMGQSPNSDEFSSELNGLPFIQGCAEFGNLYPEAKYYCENPRKVAKENSILISVRAPVGAINIANLEIGIGRGVCAIEINKSTTDYKYLYYSIIASLPELQSFSTGSTYDAVSTDDLGCLSVSLPPLPIQKAIAAYLDKETARIDALIEKKERQIELLQEKRQAIITRAVTKGLDPKAKMKDSGVEWIGEIPEGWEVRKLRYIASLKSGDCITTEQIEIEGHYPVFGGNGLRGYCEQFTNDGDYVLIGRQGALCGNINYASGKFWASEHAVVAIPVIKIEMLWLGEILKIMNLNQYSISAAQPGLAIDRIKDLYIPVPPYSEQKSLSSYFKQIISENDNFVILLKKSISLLREYRSSLITAAVSGQIDVSQEIPE